MIVIKIITKQKSISYMMNLLLQLFNKIIKSKNFKIKSSKMKIQNKIYNSSNNRKLITKYKLKNLKKL